MQLPNFLVIGAMSSGTTALYQYLREHPEIYMSPVKEPAFFALGGRPLDFRGPGDRAALAGMTTEPAAYRALFAGVRPHHRAIGEASAWYLPSAEAPRRIRRHLPDVKLVAILRDPSERAYASFRHLVRDGREPLADFAAALAEEEGRRRANWEWLWRYVAAGFYFAQLSRYRRLFDPGRIRVYLHEDLGRDPGAVVRDIFEFLEVDPGFRPDTARRLNVSGRPRSARLERLLAGTSAIRPLARLALPPRARRWIARTLVAANTRRPRVPGDVRRRLVEIYRADVLQLQALLGRDLSAWLRAG